MERFLRNLHLTNTVRIRTAVFGAGVSALRVSIAIKAISSAVSSAVSSSAVNGAKPASRAICGFLTAVPMVWGTSVSRYIMT